MKLAGQISKNNSNCNQFFFIFKYIKHASELKLYHLHFSNLGPSTLIETEASQIKKCYELGTIKILKKNFFLRKNAIKNIQSKNKLIHNLKQSKKIKISMENVNFVQKKVSVMEAFLKERVAFFCIGLSKARVLNF